MTDRAFYSVCDAGYFPGLVAMLNSLRLHGHEEPLFVVDCGLTSAQREILGAEVTFVEPPWPDSFPFTLVTKGPMDHPAEAMILIDADMIVTRRLDDWFEAAANGLVAARAPFDRFVADWGDILELGRLSRGPYLSAGLVGLGGPEGRRLLELWHDLDAFSELLYTSGACGDEPGQYPFVAIDQDVMNAIVASEHARGHVTVVDYELTPNQPFSGLEVVRGDRPSARYPDGTRPYVLHHMARKPWQAPMRSTAYIELLEWHLNQPAARIRVPAAELPVWLRGDLGGRASRAAIAARHRAGDLLRRGLPAGVVRRVDDRRIARKSRSLW